MNASQKAEQPKPRQEWQPQQQLGAPVRQPPQHHRHGGHVVAVDVKAEQRQRLNRPVNQTL